MSKKLHFGSRSGATLAESLIAVAITTFAISSIYVGSITLQKSFRASQHYAATQAAQMRVIDYVSMDLRRAVQWQADASGGKELVLWLPNYYLKKEDGNLVARHPQVGSNGQVYYGSSGQDLVKVRYYATERRDDHGLLVNDIRRAVTHDNKTEETLLVTGAQDFQPVFDEDDTKGQVVHTKVSFPPSFRPFISTGNGFRDGTSTYATTMVRNKR